VVTSRDLTRFESGRGRAKVRSARLRQASTQVALPGFTQDEWTNDDWATPWDLIRQLEAEFGPFELDPCATERTAKAPRWFEKSIDGLQQPWAGRVFCNPPYSNVGAWLRKARQSAAEGALVVCLIPAHTGRDYWHEDVDGVAEVRFLRGRVRFTGPLGLPGHAPFYSALVIYRG